ncbi:uncharacterized protein LOC108036753 [Drosophila biarmipes]|uniref:uncharacterized protein LOC108036753 n=1 Tax=Drosophila biarmipes TaxID=125945 RepID=UPI0007E5D4E2|nr:uncharacterized protein LOC108036753 [Drosophila biarmipes]
MSDENGTTTMSRFVGYTLLILAICLLVALPQWMVMCLFANDAMAYTVTCFFLSFVVLAFIHMIEMLKYSRPWNYIAIAVCYELLTLGAASFLMEWNLVCTIIVLAVGLLLLVVVLIISGILIWSGLYPNPFKMAVVGVMGLVLAFCIEVMDILLHWYYWQDVAIGVFIASAVIITISHVLITYNNFESLVRDDALLLAIVLYITYLLFLVGGRVSVFYISENAYQFDSTTTESNEEDYSD